MSRWIIQQRFPEGFDEWCYYGGPYPPSGFEPHANFIQYLHSKNMSASPSALRDYISLMTMEGFRWQALKIAGMENGEWKLHFNPLTSTAHYDHVTLKSTDIWDVSVEGNMKAMEIIGLTTSVIRFRGATSDEPMRLVNSVIGALQLDKITYPFRCSLELEHCWIGTLVLPSSCVKNLKIEGGGIANIYCPPADAENPIIGDVVIKNVFFPTSVHQTILFEGSQAYRSLHAHLKKHDNIPAANLMRGLQLRSERTHDEGFTKLANWIYGTFAVYGTSPGKPLRWVMALYVLTCILIYIFDMGAPTQELSTYVGAYAGIIDEKWGRLIRSLLLPLHAIVNPFGIFFDTRRLIVPSTSWGAILLTIQGLCSDMLVLMTILSIRRRFKSE